jgi:ribosomal protein S13
LEEESTDIVCIQEPYNIGNKIGLPRSRTVLTSGVGKRRAAIVINNKQIDTILITQLSDEDATVMETRVGSVTFVVASMYFYIYQPIDDLQKMQAVITHVQGMGIALR